MLIRRKREKSTNILIAIVAVFLVCHFFRLLVYVSHLDLTCAFSTTVL